jgi:hypothetical protein
MGYRMPLLPVDRTEDFENQVGRAAEEQRQDAQTIGESNAAYQLARGGVAGDILDKGMQGFKFGAGMRQAADQNRRAEESHLHQQELGQQTYQGNQLKLAEEQARQAYMGQPATVDTQGPTRQQAAWQQQLDAPGIQQQQWQQQYALAEKQVAMQGASNALQNKMLQFNMNQQKIAQAATMYQRANTAAMQSGQPADYSQIDAQLGQAGYAPSEIAMAHFMGNGSDPMTQLMMNQVADQQTGGLISDFATEAKKSQIALDSLNKNAQIYKANEGNVAEGSASDDARKAITQTLRDAGMNAQADKIDASLASRVGGYVLTGEKSVQRSALIDDAIKNLHDQAERRLIQIHDKIPQQYQRLPQVLMGFKSLNQLQNQTPGKNDAPFLPPPSNPGMQKVNGGGRVSPFRPAGAQ